MEPNGDAPHLGLDLDGVLDEATEFFRTLTAIWPGRVTIISYRDDTAKAERDLAALGIRYDRLVLVDSFEQKARVVEDLGIRVYVDDQPEMLRDMPAGVAVMLFRNEGNFDFESRRFVLSRATGRLL